jgi:hypothetical protein
VRLDLGVVQRDRAFDRPARSGAARPSQTSSKILQPDRIQRHVVQPVDDLGLVVALARFLRSVLGVRGARSWRHS